MANTLREKTILLVDDDIDMLYLMQHILAETEAQIYTAADGEEGLRQFFARRPDLVIVDLMMPKTDGWEVCRSIRQLADTPIVILTALGHDEAVIRGLNCGADDFITKPVSPSVFLARVQAALRRAELPASGQKPIRYSDGYLTIDLDQRRVLVEESSVRLSATEFRLLAYLLRNAGRMVTFQQILQHVWGEQYLENAEYVHVYVSRLRQKLEKDSRRPIYLMTEHGVGYRFEKQN